MKTKITKTIFILGTFFFFVAAKAQYTAIPDTNFENYLYTQGMDNINGDHQVLTVNIAGVTSLNVSSKNISDLTGIQAFSALRNLYCNYNSLTSLEVTALSNLQHVLLNLFSAAGIEFEHHFLIAFVRSGRSRMCPNRK